MQEGLLRLLADQCHHPTLKGNDCMNPVNRSFQAVYGHSLCQRHIQACYEHQSVIGSDVCEQQALGRLNTTQAVRLQEAVNEYCSKDRL